MVVNNELSENKKPGFFVFSAALCALVLVITIGLFAYNKVNENKLETLNSDLDKINSSIEVERQDGYYVVYKMTKNSQAMLERYRNYSAIPEFVNNLKKLSDSKNIIFKGFNYHEGKLQTQATVNTTELSGASEKLSNFIGYFREENNYIFSLDFVNNVSGQEKIRFNATFNLR